jgi:hypothetical protein
MKQEHTEGPWEAYDNVIMAWPVSPHQTNKEHQIAKVTKTIYGKKIKKITGYKANAQLIAAAPCLLKALENALPLLGVCEGPHWSSVLKQAEQAIRKACGRII